MNTHCEYKVNGISLSGLLYFMSVLHELGTCWRSPGPAWTGLYQAAGRSSLRSWLRRVFQSGKHAKCFRIYSYIQHFAKNGPTNQQKMPSSAKRSVNLPTKVGLISAEFSLREICQKPWKTKTCNSGHVQKAISGNSRIYFSDIWGQAYFLTFLLFKRELHHEGSIFILRS